MANLRAYALLLAFAGGVLLTQPKVETTREPA